MYKKIKLFLSKCNVANVLAAIALTVATVSANSCCVFVYHQPEMPEGIKKLRRF